MADFLTRLVQRTSGQASAIKPVVRSSYGTLPHVIESVDEFEETVTFKGIETPAATDAWHTGRNNLLTTGRENAEASQLFANSEVNNLLVKSPVADPISQRQFGRQIGRNSDQVSSEGKTATTADRNGNRRGSKSGRVVANRHLTADAALTVSQKKSNTDNTSVQIKSVNDNMEPKSNGSQRRSVLAQAAREDRIIPISRRNIGRRGAVSDNSDRTKQTVSLQGEQEAIILRSSEETASHQRITADTATPILQRNSRLADDSVRGLSPDLVLSKHEESIIPSRQEDPRTQQSIVENMAKHTPDRLSGRMAERASLGNERLPSANIRVTIGRVEIRAMQQPERKATSIPSATRRPAVSLDAYLKGRNEEKR